MATARLNRKGFLKNLGVAAAALLVRPAAAAGALRPGETTGAKAPAGPLTARKAPNAVAWRADRA